MTGRSGAVTLSLTFILAAGCSSEQQETHYKTLSAAEMAGAVHQGWIPEWLPKNAHNLKEKHDTQTNGSILRFDFPESDKWTPSSDCSPVPASQVQAPAVKAAWWPKDVPTTETTSTSYSYYTCTGAGARELMAVDFSRGEALHWRLP